MIKQIKIQIGFLLEPIYHVLIVEIPDNKNYSKKNTNFKFNNNVKGKYKSTRKNRHSTF